MKFLLRGTNCKSDNGSTGGRNYSAFYVHHYMQKMRRYKHKAIVKSESKYTIPARRNSIIIMPFLGI